MGVYPGEVVYYVNGMATEKARALVEAKALSDRLRRPVELLYNAPPLGVDEEFKWNVRIQADLTVCAYDRSWPWQGRKDHALAQAHPVTRQLTYVLCHAAGKVAIVSHSQGCLIARNAIMTADWLSGGHVADRVAWVATGIPLRDEEIYPKPAKLRVLANAADPVCQSIGLRLDPEKFTEQAFEAHDFVEKYLDRIQTADLW